MYGAGWWSGSVGEQMLNTQTNKTKFKQPCSHNALKVEFHSKI